ncbi:SH3 and cysteine-rich domain-containing protein 2-like isoform X1 [Acipenser oxyrinchus oxyrinchus]|uniref:SH3 and cysteine-rich domain-containing protein 2-like isoform X1 n=1 Tax=Acipenser oxyrinchus oxyrinchus TaxID=40147 RepID=A0AAD8D0M9_ACIOX|nr:SH3 and cysteine-rich domain-containing protein 2-like isoform X1 [Acipenser oxyrinchus oxyrinchus]
MTENSEKENEPQKVQRSPGTVSIQPVSKLQRLKRSLSFKTMSRSRSVENFQRSNSEIRLPVDLITAPPLPENPPPAPSPALSSKTSTQLRPLHMHCFQEHVFRKPTHCQLCKHMIVGNSKQGVRCEACKLGAHLWCSLELLQQQCNGKSGAFKWNSSSPLLVNDQLGVMKEAPLPAEKARVDPVYETLRYGTSLAQLGRSSFGSISESPTRSVNERDEGGEESLRSGQEETGSQECEKAVSEDRVSLKTRCRLERPPKHSYVALYKFLPQEVNDLELQPGDRVQVTDDSNEDWWKGKSAEKVGFFPVNFVQRVRPGERVWRASQSYQGRRELEQMSVKECQICVGKGEDREGFLKVSSGKKRGLVPTDLLEEI